MKKGIMLKMMVMRRLRNSLRINGFPVFQTEMLVFFLSYSHCNLFIFILTAHQ